jgi:hypothetical protein
MNAVKIVTILCWLVVAIVMVGLVVWFITGNLFGFQTNFNIIRPTFHIGSFEDMTGPMAEAGTYTVEADSVDSLNVDWVSGEISITPYDGSDIIITEYARRQLNEDEKLSYGVTGGTLNIRYISTPMTFNMMLTKKLEVFVPESIAERALTCLCESDTSGPQLTVSDLTGQSSGNPRDLGDQAS